MTIRYYTIPYEWSPLQAGTEQQNEEITNKLMSLFLAWEGTPYMSGNQRIGQGVDCVRWVSTILDTMYGQPPQNIVTLPSDGSFHNRKGAMRTMLKIKRTYSHCKVIKDQPLQPGDLVVVGSPGGGPGHAMLVGTKPNTLWHCTPNNGVTRTGWALVCGCQKIFRVYRAKDRGKLWTT